MAEQPDRARRRRRRRLPAAQPAAPPTAPTAPSESTAPTGTAQPPDDPAAAGAENTAATTAAMDLPLPGPAAAPGGHSAEPKPAEPRARRSGDARKARPRVASVDPAERGLRDLVGAGRSQLGVNGALRGRDVNRPTEADLADAEANLVIVRRHWQPADKRPSDPPAAGDP